MLIFFKHKSDFPNFKKKNISDVKMYFVKDNKTDCLSERHRIKIPTLGWVRLKEKGYIPTSKDSFVIKSGTISYKAGKYYISVLIDMPEQNIQVNNNLGIGIDLGLKDFAICSDGSVYNNINKTIGIKKIEKKLKREQRKLSRKIVSSKNNST